MHFCKPLSILLMGVAVIARTAFSGPDDTLPPHRDGVVLLKFKPGTTPNEQQAVLNAVGASAVKQIGEGVMVVNVGTDRVFGVLRSLAARNETLYNEPDYQIVAHEDVKGSVHSIQEQSRTSAALSVSNTIRATQTSATIQPSALTQQNAGTLPNDTSIGMQWAVQNTGQNVSGVSGTSGADERSASAWTISGGTNSSVVAVLDTGIQYSHPDLLTNMWNNPGGVGSCAAGTHGYNVLTSLCDPLDDETFYGGHGSHVAGIIGALGNNSLGVAGVNWTTSLMAVKWADSNDSGYTSDLIRGMDWIINAKKAGVNIRVANDSQTTVGTPFSQALSDEIDLLTANDILFVTAAGNTAQNNDTTPRYPCSYDRPGMICAAATDQNDKLWTSSNYGPTSVQLAAPGVNILSTLHLSNFGYVSGGSMAAAQVSGAAALILSKGYLSVTDLRSTILTNVDVLSSLTGLVGTGGRLNVCKAVPGCSTASTGTPANSVAPVLTGIAQAGSVMGVSTGIWSGAPTTYTYQWYRCNSTGTNCTSISGATSSMYALLAGADSGSTLAATVTASNAAGSAAAQSAPSAVVRVASSPFNLNPTVTDGETITGTALWQATPGQSVNFVSFYIDGVLAQTVSSSLYEYNQSTTGTLDSTTLSNGTHVLGVRALASDNRTYAFYGATVTVANPPRNTALPVIAGNPTQGQTLTASNGSWTNNPTSFTYQWNRCNSGGSSCNGISGATSSTYLIGAADLGFTLRVSVTATNSIGFTTAQSAATAVVSGSVSITTTTLPNGTQDAAYSTTLVATGGVTPYRWAVTAGALPAGLSLAGSTGVISGTPTGTGTSNFTVQVTDSNAQTASQAFSLIVNTGTTTSGPALVQSSAVQGSSVTSVRVAFPNGNTAGNLIVAFVRMSSTTQTVTVTDSGGNTYTDAVAQTQSSDGHQVHIFYARNIVGGANTVTATFSSSNTHPWLAIYEYSGLSKTNPLDRTAAAQGNSTTASTGSTPTTTSANELVFVGSGLPSSFSGTATAGSGYTLAQQDTSTSRASNEAAVVTSTGSYAGSFALSRVTNWTAVIATFVAAGASSGPTITTTTLPNGTQNAAYSTTLVATGGVTPYRWVVTAGALPAGLLLAGSTGVISGTPTGTGTSNFTVQVTDSNAQTASQALSLIVNTGTTTSGPVLVQSSAVQGSSVASVRVAFPSGNTAGNLIVAFVRMSSTTQAVTVTDSGGNTYADAVAQTQSSDGHQVHIFYARNIVGGTNTVTATFSSSNNHPWLAIYEYSGLSKTNPLDRTAAAQGNSASASTGSTLTTTSANELVFVGTGLPSSFSGTATAGSGYTLAQQDTSTSRASNEAAAVTSTGSYTGSFALSPSTSWTAVIATFAGGN